MGNEVRANGRTQIGISVRNLVEFVLRSGDIDNRIGAHDQIEAMQEGTRIHKRIQAAGGPRYHAEVPLSHTISYDDYDLIVEGRADGIVCDYDEVERFKTVASQERIGAESVGADGEVPGQISVGADGEVSGQESVAIYPEVLIDEIKGVYLDLDLLKEPQMLHLAQAKCYAYMFALANHLPAIDVQITYCNMESYEVRRFREKYSFEDIAEWYEKVIALYKRWADMSYYWRITRQNSIEVLRFPYEYRPGQKEVAQDVYRTIARNKILFIQAPTGSGKTLSTLFPSVMAVGQGLAERIFYLTAKTVTRVVARETFEKFYDQGYRAKTVEITAKDKLCPLEKRECNPDACEYAKGHFDRINDAVYDLLQERDLFTRDVIADWGEKRKVCPFELNLDVSSWCDNIIGDYNYVFDPNVYLKRFFAAGSSSEGIFLIDEAHNLIERAREMYSASLTKESFLATKKYFKVYNGGIPKALDRCNKLMLGYKRECDQVYFPEELDPFIMALTHLVGAFQKFFETKINLEHMDEIRQFYFDVLNFLARAAERDSKYIVYCDYDTLGEFAIHMFCVDPSTQLTGRLLKANASVLFSATMLPINYYKKLLTTVPDPYAIYAQTSFTQDQRLLLIGTDVTSRYKRRGPEEYSRYAAYITKIVSAHPGNYMVFFPSYRVMEDIIAEASPELADRGIEYITQESGMTEAVRDEFLGRFDEERDGTLVAFCVLGGIFSEGIDLTGERLIGVIIVGAGLPQVSVQRRLISDYFDREREGFSYAYLYPGMNKVAQAAGRVIRTATDTGVIALLDDRFMLSDYRRAFPREWSDAKPCTLDNIGDKLRDFWGNI